MTRVTRVTQVMLVLRVPPAVRVMRQPVPPVLVPDAETER
ncbi:hypothetical protein GCM10010425_24830 [Streptomyces spororaveus]|uniref:Uncharacterized protein n=1 Tax=Streptomyces spororaveus TaxID=284039 RepID=A0ABQ3TGP8_9ACTN|nr:hypothetical protein Sspor_51410 [Streptomyces spororaveus]